MKNAWMLLLVLLSLSMVAPDTCQAQLFKGFGRKVEKKVKNKIEQKAERHVDKTINTADRKSDESIEKAVKGDRKKKKNRREDRRYEEASSTLAQDIPVRKEQAMTMISSSACNDSLWFKQGAYFEYEQEVASNNHTSQMRAIGVSQRGGQTASEILASQQTDEGPVEFTLNYVCDGDNFYLDMSAMSEQIMQQIDMNSSDNDAQVKEALDSAEFNVSDGFTAIPKVLYPGMRLPDASLSFTMNVSGMEMVVNSDVTDRIVVAKEAVTTKAGTFECMKIQSTTTVTMNMMGRYMNTGSTTDYVWMTPEVGVVKQETHSNNKVDYRMILSKLER